MEAAGCLGPSYLTVEYLYIGQGLFLFCFKKQALGSGVWKRLDVAQISFLGSDGVAAAEVGTQINQLSILKQWIFSGTPSHSEQNNSEYRKSSISPMPSTHLDAPQLLLNSMDFLGTLSSNCTEPTWVTCRVCVVEGEK